MDDVLQSFGKYEKCISFEVYRIWARKGEHLTKLGLTREDLQQGAYVRLAQMIDRKRKGHYDKSKAQFLTWFQSQIHGAIIDTVRAYQWTKPVYERHTSSGWRNGKKVIPFFVNLAGDMCYDSTDKEGSDKKAKEILELGRVEEAPQERVAIAKEQVGLVFEEVSKMPKRYQYAFVRYFVDGISLSKIGKELKVTESRASQMVTKAKDRLHKLFEVRGLIEKREANMGIHHHSRSEPVNCDTFLFNNSRGVCYAL